MEEQKSDTTNSSNNTNNNVQSTVDEFVKKQNELIELEKQEEVEKIERLLDSLPRAVRSNSTLIISSILRASLSPLES